MLEVEMKFPIGDFKDLEGELLRRGAEAGPEREDADYYYNAPDRDFARTDEALRIRRIGTENFVTYKGPKRDALTKTRTEVEVPFAPGQVIAASMGQLLQHLGYRLTGVVLKKRKIYHLNWLGLTTEITLDDVRGVGKFTELEIQAPDEHYAVARDALLMLADELRLEKSERRSYLEMWLEAQRKDG